ncbi:MAG: MBL fold metallo-hydrolase [Rhodospirillales bacterium]|nr:MBL fold metallo-hydrolase [Alphaproteobacteria bacterium]MBL6948755.1 MBL fold metallo-hydrolase [Rhodospirillales bacterium]
MKVTILGSGPSSGIPAIHEGWGDCDPENPKNRRLRPSILVESGDTIVLVDTSPDLRQQLLNAGIRRLDAVLYTHGHADHLHGIDDLRGVNKAMNAELPVYADATTIDIINQRFDYTVTPLAPGVDIYYKPVLNLHEVSPGDRFQIGELDIRAFDQDHGFSRTLGFRFGDFAFTTDLLHLPEESFAVLEGVGTWIIGVFSIQPHMTHTHVDQALEWIDRIKPERAILTHLGPTIDYAKLNDDLPDGVEAAYDGMEIEI